MMTNLEKCKEHLKPSLLHSQVFFCRNTVDDPMETIYKDNSLQIDRCDRYGYYEVFGLDSDDQEKLHTWFREQFMSRTGLSGDWI